MKKLYSLLCLILIAILALSMVSCNNKENDEDPEGDPGTGGYTASSTQIRAIDFEDYLYTVTDVVIGKCQRAECSNGYYYYDFDVTESLRGKGTDSKITIEMLNTDFVMTDLDESADNKRFSTKDLKYETGKSYLLLLKRVDSVYNASETLYFAASTLVLPMEALNDSSRSDELKLYNTKLKDRVKDEETLKAIDEGRFTQRILELVKDNPTVSGTKYLKETDLATVIEKSDYVFKITIKNESTIYEERETYKCTVNEVLKGQYSEEIISVVFPPKTVKVGESYIIALYKDENSSFVFYWSSKASLYPLSEYDNIKNLLN